MHALFSSSKTLGEPDPFRLQYRNVIAETIVKIINGQMNKKNATAFIKKFAAKRVPKENFARFIEVIETEFMELHEGNIARYRLRPSQYQMWQETWE